MSQAGRGEWFIEKSEKAKSPCQMGHDLFCKIKSLALIVVSRKIFAIFTSEFKVRAECETLTPSQFFAFSSPLSSQSTIRIIKTMTLRFWSWRGIINIKQQKRKKYICVYVASWMNALFILKGKVDPVLWKTPRLAETPILRLCSLLFKVKDKVKNPEKQLSSLSKQSTLKF